MSSTETESNPGSRPVRSGPRAKAKRQAKAKPKFALSSGSQEFNLKFLDKLHHLKKSGRGCEHCGFKCFEVAEPFLSGLVTWRSEFSKLGNEVADKELRWIFQVCRRNVSGLAPAVAQSSGKRSFSHDSTETSCEEDKKGRKRVKLDESMTDTSNPSRSSSEALDMEEIKKPRSSEPARKPIILKKAKSQQAGKRRLSTKAPSVDLAKFILREPQGGGAGGFVCLKASRFFLGISDGRLSRVACFNLISAICFHNLFGSYFTMFHGIGVHSEVLSGREDRRCGENHVKTNVSKELDICNTFLRLRYHNDGEFLPDKFHFDGMEQPVGYVIGPPDPSRPKSQEVAEDLSSEDDMSSASKEGQGQVVQRDREEDERAISALSIAAVTHNEPFHNSHVGPGANPGPRKYLGVVKPAILYESMVLWANDSNHVPAPSFTTFRRALKAARPWLRFRSFAPCANYFFFHACKG